MPCFDTRFLVIDTETTGLDPNEDRICELGAAYFENRAFTERRRMLIDPEIPIPPDASQVHGITDDRVAGKPRFAEVADQFVKHLTGEALGGEAPVFVGYNAISFDVPILNVELERAGRKERVDPTAVIDPMLFVRWHLRHLRKRTLEHACQHFGVALERAHAADADARATGELLLAMVQAGMIPDDVQAAFSEQVRLAPLLDEENALWTYWLYRDRIDSRVRMGAGKHVGCLLAEVDPGYLAFLLHKIDDLPEAVRTEFERIGSGK